MILNAPMHANGKTLQAAIADRLHKYLGDETPTEPRELLMHLAAAGSGGTSTIDRFNDLVGLIRDPIALAFKAAPDSTQGWTKRVEMTDYKNSQISIVDKPVILTQVTRGGSAATINFGLTGPQGWHLARFGARFELDEQDLIDGALLDPVQMALGEIGTAAARLIPDLAYAFLFNNSALPDGTALFHTSRSNIASSSSALAAATLGTAYGAMAGQIPVDTGGRPAHVNLVPRYLVVSPSIGFTARAIARDYATGQNDLIVRTESRISTTGVYDPLADEVVTSLNTAWLLAASADQAPSVVVGGLDGKFEPTITMGKIESGGKFGLWCAVQFSVAVSAVSGRGLYWANGT